MAKSDIDMVADRYIDELHVLLRQLTIKLYRRNPRELRKVKSVTIDSRLAQLFGESDHLKFDELFGKQNTDAILLALDPAYAGDRVFALMAGLTGMIRQSYGGKHEFFLLDDLDGQQLYNCARNIEITNWRLNHRLDRSGNRLILANALPGETINYGFERLFAKMVAHQDMMARIMADKNDRTIKTVVQSVATAAFLPVGL